MLFGEEGEFDPGGVASSSKYRKKYTSEHAKEEAIRGTIAALQGKDRARDFLYDKSENMIAKKYVDARILPVIDDLVYKHTDGKQDSLTPADFEKTFIEMMSRMVEDGVMKKKEMDAYIKPTKRLLRKDGPSQFQKDLKATMFDKDGKLETLDIKSFADKCWNLVRKASKFFGLTGLAASCGNRMSAANKQKISNIENRSAEMTEKVLNQAKAIGMKTGNQKVSERVATKTKAAITKRARNSKSSRGR